MSEIKRVISKDRHKRSHWLCRYYLDYTYHNTSGLLAYVLTMHNRHVSINQLRLPEMNLFRSQPTSVAMI